MDNNIFNEIGTTLDLNGPILSYSEQPTGSTGIGTEIDGTGGGSISFTGIATGVDPGTGYISYQWYEQDVGKLSDSTYVTGTASTGPVGTAATLTISNLVTPTDNQRKFYLVTDYVASAYGTGRSTGNAWNEPLSSGIATATVSPLIEIVAQPPEGVQSLINENATISVNADLTDSYFADDLIYQWYLNGESVSDGTKTVTTTTGTTQAGTVERTYTSPGNHTLPAVGIENLEITLGAASGGGGGSDSGGPGGSGGNARVGRFSLPDSLKGQLMTFGVGRSGNGGSSGGPSAYGRGGILDGDDTTVAQTDVSFTITESTSGNSKNEGSDFVFDFPGCAGSPGTYTLTARSGTHTRDIPSGYENNSLCTHFTMGSGLDGIGHVRIRNNGKTLDWIKPSNISIINDTPTVSVTINRGTWEFQGDGSVTLTTLNQWYNYTYARQSQSQVHRIKWKYEAPVIVDVEDDGDGGAGGGAGGNGWSGGGGGGGAASYVKDTDGKIIVAGGGGGGGGGSWRAGGPGGSLGNTFTSTTGNVPISDGSRGTTKSGDGGGGGGGGGGSPGGSGGGSGQDRAYGGYGGNGGGSRYDSDRSTLVSQWTASGAGFANIKYTGYTSKTVTITTNTILSGTTTPNLTISCDTVGVQTCQCKITSATASNSPIWTDVTNFVTTDTAKQYKIITEAIGITNSASLSLVDLGNGEITFDTTQSQVSSGSITNYYSIFAGEKDIDVEMDLYGGKGDDKGSYTGGEGGYSRIRFTMRQHEEYVIVGLSTDTVNTPFVYRQGELIACVGQGGAAGKAGKGGNGGGVLNAGQDGRGMSSGNGGFSIAEGTISSHGIFGSRYPAGTVYVGDSQATNQDGGRTIRCTKGVYWAQQGIGACDDMAGTNVFRLSDGTPVTNTSLITRGFKAGYNIMETAGSQDGNGGVGGNGATGGQGASEGGGGGGSGYSDGTITVVDTQQGGSTGDAKVILRIVT